MHLTGEKVHGTNQGGYWRAGKEIDLAVQQLTLCTSGQSCLCCKDGCRRTAYSDCRCKRHYPRNTRGSSEITFSVQWYHVCVIHNGYFMLDDYSGELVGLSWVTACSSSELNLVKYSLYQPAISCFSCTV